MSSYSQRISWSAAPNRFTQLIRERRCAGAPLIDLTVSNPTLALADYPHDALSAAMGRVRDFRYQPDPLGDPFARNVIAAEYKKSGTDVSPGDIALTASTSEAYGLLFKLLCNPEDAVLVPVPSYPLFDFLAKLECVQTVPYRMLYDGSWYLDIEDLRAKISGRTKAVVIVNPNNPTGSFLKPAERRALAELASKYSLPVICDEVFLDYPLAEAAPGGTLLGCGAPLTFCLNGLSKMAGMPHLKLGWIVLDGDRAKVRAARDRLELILDTYLSVNLPVQSALSDLFAVGDEIRAKLLARIRGNFAFLKAELTASAVHVLTTEGGWSAILQLPKVLTEEVWVERLLTEQDIIVQPGYFFDMFSEPYVVVSLIAEPEAFRIGVRRLKTLSSAG